MSDTVNRQADPVRPPQPKRRDARIAIIGAGPAGLATGWFLKEAGFTNVTIFEQYGRVGGLCFTLNDGYRSFDLGGNYITPAYRETRRIARAVGAETYKGSDYVGARPAKDGSTRLEFVDMKRVVREIRDANGEVTGHVGYVAFLWAILRYIIARWRVRGVIDQPSFAEVHRHPELCKTFDEWLADNNLTQLRSLFEIPITMFGYGFLDEIAAPYALKYMNLLTFIAMFVRQIPVLKSLSPWPRRFTFGFQRMWEAVGWRLNVRHNVVIKEIWRLGDPPPEGEQPTADHPIRIDLQYPSRIFNRDAPACFTRWFDHLIVASSRVGVLQEAFNMEPDGAELTLARKVSTFGFCMTTMHPEPVAEGKPFKLQNRVVCVLPFRKKDDRAFCEEKDSPYRPWVVVQLWPEDTAMLQCYTRLPEEDEFTDRREVVIGEAEKLLQALGVKRAGTSDPRRMRWEHYEQWPYFGHVDPQEIKDGFFRDLEELQGYRNTYWVGGFTNFELIEPIVCYAKSIVGQHFVPS